MRRISGNRDAGGRHRSAAAVHQPPSLGWGKTPGALMQPLLDSLPGNQLRVKGALMPSREMVDTGFEPVTSSV